MLLNRAFFSAAVIALLQEGNVPFVMPVMLRGRPPKKGRPVTGLRWIKRQPAGWYRQTSVSADACRHAVDYIGHGAVDRSADSSGVQSVAAVAWMRSDDRVVVVLDEVCIFRLGENLHRINAILIEIQNIIDTGEPAFHQNVEGAILTVDCVIFFVHLVHNA